MRQRILTCTIAVAAAVVAMFVSVQQQHPSEAAAVTSDIVTSDIVTSDITRAVKNFETTRIVPADVLGTGVVCWAPLAGDGANGGCLA